MSELLAAVWAEARRKPVLFVPPLAGLVLGGAPGLLGAGPAPLGALWIALTTAAVTTAFAELWLGDGRLDADKFVETGALYLAPYPLLFVFGSVSAAVVYAGLQSGAGRPLVSFFIAAGKLTAYALCFWSTLAALKRREARGALDALKRALRPLAGNAGFFLGAALGVWLAQETAVYVSRLVFLGFLSAFLSSAIPLFGCVGLTIEAWRSGRLAK